MRPSLPPFLVPALLLAATAGPAQLAGSALAGQPIPEILYNSDPGVQFPVWVSAAAAIDPSGVVNERLFPAQLKERIESYFAEPVEGYWAKPKTDGCYNVEEFYVSRVNPPNRSTLDRAAKHSEVILIGRIVAGAYGFHFSIPGELFLIEPSQLLHGEALLDRYYIFFPVGEFSAGPYRICKSDIRYPSPPDIGDELLIMVPPERFYSSTDSFFELDEASSIVVIPAKGELRFPRVFKDSTEQKSTSLVKSKAELIAAVKKALSKNEVLP